MPRPDIGGVVDAGMSEAKEALNRVFGFTDFRPGQQEILEAVFAGENILAIMPTGSGKSLCYQLPALVRKGLTVVISPLIALMRDQVQQLQVRGIAAATLNSSISGADNAAVEAGLRRGLYRLVYVSPERLVRPDMPALLREAGAQMFAIDEAHCVSQWGHDFRPEYLGIAQAARAIGDLQIIAVTATADLSTRSEIAEQLFPAPPNVFVRSFDRPNIRLAFRRRTDTLRQIETVLHRHKRQSGIIYCRTRKGSESLAQILAERGVPTLAYHAGLEPQSRSDREDEFLRHDAMIMVATIAFGMGIDKPNVRFVCHADLPDSIEAYYHETGRAGRDGLPAESMTLFSESDIEKRAKQIFMSDAPEDRKRIERQKLNSLVALCESPRCRRQTLLAAFGEASIPCGNCDICDQRWPSLARVAAAQRVSFAIQQAARRLFAHRTAGFFADSGATDLAHVEEMGDKPWTFEPPKARMQIEQLTARQNRLFVALKAKRLEIALRQRQAPVLIFDDAILFEMAKTCPKTREEIMSIPGVQPEKFDRYGAMFVAVVLDHSEFS